MPPRPPVLARRVFSFQVTRPHRLSFPDLYRLRIGDFPRAGAPRAGLIRRKRMAELASFISTFWHLPKQSGHCISVSMVFSSNRPMLAVREFSTLASRSNAPQSDDDR
jgi:hypothetical protein